MKLIRYGLFALGLASQAAMGQFLSSGISTIDLSMTGVAGTPMNIAWDPVYQQYYGGGGGLLSDSGAVWNATGGNIQILTPLNTDLRSFYYNSRSGNLEEVTYNAVNPSGVYGYKTVGLDSSGLLSSPASYTNIGVTLSGLPTAQVAPAYDAARNLLYAFDSGNTVTAVSAATGLAVSTITLNLSAAGTSSLVLYSIGYDPVTNALISFTTTGGNRALAFSATTGAFLASIPLAGLTSPTSSYALSFVNNQLFVYDSTLNAYSGYFITTPVPEPGTATLLGVGLLAVITRWRYRRRD
jgi:hypothetical protein